jgi:hypothetical protein
MSAVLGLPSGDQPGEEETFPIPSDHREMCRFKSLGDPGFQQAWTVIRGIINNRRKLKSLSADGEMSNARPQPPNLRGHEPSIPLLQKTERLYTCDGVSLLIHYGTLSSRFTDLRCRIPCLS